jgi:NAD(P)-dependent dehydrogenase (short-subunit alcohol dehydrogenase family)
VVTGAAQGLGRAYAQAFAGEDATLMCVDENHPGVEETATLIRSSGGNAEAHSFDVADAAAVARRRASASDDEKSSTMENEPLRFESGARADGLSAIGRMSCGQCGP